MPKFKLLFLLTVFLLSILTASPLTAQTSNTIHGCYNAANGNLRRVNGPGDCRLLHLV